MAILLHVLYLYWNRVILEFMKFFFHSISQEI